MVNGSGANYSYENSLLLPLDNIGGGYRYCAVERADGAPIVKIFPMRSEKRQKHAVQLVKFK